MYAHGYRQYWQLKRIIQDLKVMPATKLSHLKEISSTDVPTLTTITHAGIKAQKSSGAK